jgi:hypothetical protein
MRLAAAFGSSALVLIAAGANAAPLASPADALAAAPSSAVDYAFPKNGTDVNGLAPANQAVWVNVGAQRAIMDEIVNGTVHADANRIDAHWPVFAASLAHERADGSFEYASNEAFDGQPGADAFWLGYSAQALLLLQSSRLGPQYASRIAAIRPQLAATAQWLAQPAQMAYLLHFDGGVTPRNPTVSGANRLINDAKALILAAKLTGAPGAQEAGEQLLDRALASQSSQGWFPEHDGPDTSYNAVSAMQLAWIALFVNDPRLAPAIARSMDWEMGRIDSSGRIDDAGNTRTGNGHLMANGKPYPINYSDVTKALVLSSIVTNDPRMMNDAVLVSDYARKNF